MMGMNTHRTRLIPSRKEMSNMNISKVNIEIEGIVPLKMDRFHNLPDPKTPEEYFKQAQEKCYRDSRRLIFPSAYE
jgi:hypothetical protein